jgi:hypothetical protein
VIEVYFNCTTILEKTAKETFSNQEISYRKRDSAIGIWHIANGQKRWLPCLCKAKHGTILPVNTIYGFCVYLQILEQTLYLSSFDSKGTPELGKL